MTNEQVNDWRYPPVPKAIQEALKDYPELLAHLEWALNDDDWRMSNSLSLSQRVDRLISITNYLKDGLMYFSSQARAKLEAAEAIGDAAAIAAAQAEREAVSKARNNDLKYWDELEDFYGIEMSPEEGKGLRIKEGRYSWQILQNLSCRLKSTSKCLSKTFLGTQILLKPLQLHKSIPRRVV